jgi:Protein of unknown function (DUF2971)
MKYHDHSHFYKYLSIDGLQYITKNLTMRYASPSTFNDPFDSQFELGFDFEFEEAGQALLEKMEEFVFGDDEPEGNTENRLFKALSLTRKNRHQHNIEEFREYFKSSVDKNIQFSKNAQPGLNKTWKSVFDTIRIFCVTEDHKNLLMWSHYADKHEGAVIRIGCIKEIDSVLLAAVPVCYTDQTPVIATKDEWINSLIGLSEIDYDQHLKKIVTTKSKEWEYEKEWRVYTFVQPSSIDDGKYLYQIFSPKEIQAIYFGCKVDEKTIDKIRKEMHPDLSHVEFYNAKRLKWKFGIDFGRIF